MKTYRVNAMYANFGVGTVLKLSEAQADVRVHALKRQEKHTFVVTSAVQFKHGEVLTLVKGHLSRAQEVCLVEVGNKKTEFITAK